MITTEFLIIGKGLAGTLLAHFLLKAGKTVHIIDDEMPNAASRIAAGLINPVTGRHFVKSWRIDTLLPFALETYSQLEEQYQVKIFHSKPILRALADLGDVNHWQLRRSEAGYESYLSANADWSDYAALLHPAFDYGETRLGGQTDLPALLAATDSDWQKADIIYHAKFDFDKLKILPGGLQYDHLFRAEKIIFCEGFRGKQNPFFAHLPWQGAKGEVFLLKIEGPLPEKIVKQDLFLIPLQDGRIWCGANYANYFEDELPSEKGRRFLLEKLEKILKVPFKIVSHRAAVRPTVQDRRPFLGSHPEHTKLFIFNGLGTKGASLGPYFAKQMADFLVHGQSLDPEVDVARFK